MTIEEIESIIRKNMIITDERLYEAVMSVALDVEKAEREQIKEIINQVGVQANHNEWFDCCVTILKRIEDDSRSI